MEQREQTGQVQVGQTVGEGWGIVLTVFAQEGSGSQVVRAYAAHKREYAVMTIDAMGVVRNARYTPDAARSMLLFSEVMLDLLYRQYNMLAPTVSWDRPNPTGRI